MRESAFVPNAPNAASGVKLLLERIKGVSVENWFTGSGVLNERLDYILYTIYTNDYIRS